MKKNHVLLYLASAMLIITSCKKDSPNTNPMPNTPNTPATPASEFLLNGVSDVTFTAGIGIMGVEISHVSGPQAKVDLSLTDLPPGVEAKFSSQSGTPTFTSAITFTTTGQSGGSFPVTLKASNSTISKNYSFNLNLEQGDDCADEVVRRQARKVAGNDCLNGGLSVEVDITADPSAFGRVRIAFERSGSGGIELPYKYSFYADVNCFNGSAVIPSQSIGYGKEVSGTATDLLSYPATLQLTFKDESGETTDCTIGLY